MRIYLPPADDDGSPTRDDLREFAKRLYMERDDAARRPSFDDTWQWFLSLFERKSDSSKPDGKSTRRAA